MRTDGEIRTVAARAMDAMGVLVNVLATLVCIWGCLYLWKQAEGYLAAAGGMPRFTMDYAWAAINAPEPHLRAFYWFVAWVSGVFAAGLGMLSIAGLHWSWHRIRHELSR